MGLCYSISTQSPNIRIQENGSEAQIKRTSILFLEGTSCMIHELCQTIILGS